MTSRFVPPFYDVGSGVKPPSGAQLFFFAIDGVTPKDTYTTQAATTPNANPVIANSVGVFPAIYIKGDYLVTLKDKDDVQEFGLAPVSEFVTGSGQENNVLNRALLNDAVIDASLKASLTVYTVERTLGNGGSAHWKVIVAGTTPGVDLPNGFDIIACTGVPTLALFLIVIGAGEVWAEQLGAIGDGTTDNAAALQAGLDYAETNTGGLLKIGEGNFKYLTALTFPFNGSLQGVGYSTLLSPVGVNGFNFINSGIQGGRLPIKDFRIVGDNTIGSKAFNVTVDDSGAAKAIKGLAFYNIWAENFEEAWRLTGVWNCTFFHCETINMWKAVNMLGRNIHTVIDSCSFIRGTTPVGYSGNCVGLEQNIESSLRSEDIQVKNSLMFGFDIGSKISNALLVDFEGSDFDFCVETGIQFVVAEGGASIKSCWIFTKGDNGILISSIGTSSNDPLVISGNNVQRETQGTLAAEIGIDIGTGQANTSVIDNHVQKFNIATRLQSPKTRYIGNWDTDTNSHSLQFADGAKECFIEGNVFESTVDRTLARPHTHFGPNEGVLTNHYLQVAIDAGVSSQVYTWASLGLPDAINNPKISCLMNNPAATSMGNVRALATQTQVTVYRDVVLGAAAGLDMQIISF